MKRAYSIVNLKSADDEARIIEGLATSPAADRMGDIIESEGAKFILPLPLLWQHDSRSPIGHVTKATVSKDGIKITAQIAKGVDEQIEKAWRLIKGGLVRGLSIGFRALDIEPLNPKDPWGSVRVKAWEWLELSAVTIPANGEASIHAIKSIDQELRAASGAKALPVVRANPAGVTAPKATGTRGASTMPTPTTAERISAFEAQLAAKAAARAALMDAANEKGETLSAEQGEEYDALGAEIKSINIHLGRLREQQEEQKSTAKPVKTRETEEPERQPFGTVQVKAQIGPKLEPGMRVARYVKCMAIAQKHQQNVIEVAKQRYKDDPELIDMIKAVVVAGSTISGSWAADLVGAEGGAFADFLAFLRPQTIIGRFGTGGIPSLRRVPFRVPLVAQTGGGEGYWVGQGKAKPLTAFDFNRITLEPLKVANIAVLTEEVIRDSSPSADAIVRTELVNALRERLDIDFVDPAKTAAAGISPASITNGATGVPSSGNDDDAVRADIKALMDVFIAANNPPTTGVWIMSASTALALGLMVNALGQPAFPTVNMSGGTLFGMPVITSEYVAGDTAGGTVILANAGDIYLADEGGFEVALSREASLQMDDEPTQSSVASVTATSVVSMFQTNSVAFRAERTINWARRRTTSVAYLTAVNWGTTGS